MKKSMMLAAVAVAAMTATCLGQTTKKLSLFADVGYGFGIGGELAGSSTVTEGTELLEKKDKYLNYGRGLKIDAGASYSLLDMLDARFGVAFSAGIPRINVIEKTVTHPGGLDQTTIVQEKTRYSQLGFRLMGIPHFTVADLFEMYFGTGIGMYFSFCGAEGSEETKTTGGGNTLYSGQSSTKSEYKNLPAFAFLGCIGGEIPLNDILNVYAEIGFDAMTVILKESTVREYDADGDLDDTRHEVYEANSLNDPEPPKIPGTNWGIKIGVRIPIL